jgi:6-phosphogluconolactonase
VQRNRFRRTRQLAAAASVSFLLALTGCGAFFQCEGKSDCGTGTTTSSSGNYVYVSNSASGSTYLDGFQITGGSLVTATGFPASVGFTPVALAVTPSDAYLYAASATAIYGYSIGTGGAITVLNSGNAMEAENVAAIAISPDGKWLFSLNSNDLTLEEYSIGSTGLLSYEINYQLTNPGSATLISSSVMVAPTGNYIAVGLGTAGFETFSFNTSTGAAAAAATVNALSTTSGDFAVQIDSSNNLYIGSTNDLLQYSVTSAGVPTFVSQSATGTGPYSVALDGTSYIFTGSENASSTAILSAFNAGTTNPLSGASYIAPTTVAALGVDKTAGYLVAAGYNASSGIQLFTIGSTGLLVSVGSVGTGTVTTVPTVMALTH